MPQIGKMAGGLGSMLGGGTDGMSAMKGAVQDQAKMAQAGIAAGKAQSEIAMGAAAEQTKQSMETSTAMTAMKNANDLNDAVNKATAQIGSSAKSAFG
jgi:hypothetical protein